MMAGEAQSVDVPEWEVGDDGELELRWKSEEWR